MIPGISVRANYYLKKLTSFTEAVSKVLKNKDGALDAHNQQEMTLDH